MGWFSTNRYNLTSDLVDELESYWYTKVQAGGMPKRSDIDPCDFVRLLPYILLMDIQYEPFRVRYRLIGTQVALHSRLDFTGYYLDQLTFNPAAVDFGRVYREICVLKVPIYGVSEIPCVDTAYKGFYFAVFPLSEDGDTVSQCIAVEDYRAVSAFDRRRKM